MTRKDNARSAEIETALALTNELLLLRLRSDRSEAEHKETAAAIVEITSIRNQMLLDHAYDPMEKTQAIEFSLQNRTASI